MRVTDEQFDRMTLEPESDLDRHFLQMVNKSKVTQITEFQFNAYQGTFSARFCFEYPTNEKESK